ncbi:divalent-cation tolerance protein CutA, partial [Azonexus sp.]|uniref:divalent-cation tolerance protein CutA n=1 Tax=Azonexus sp. TaxID=1872668 RepID=UPI0039E65E2A
MDHCLVLTNCPDTETARGIARALLTERLAACVSLLVPAVSLYRWQGALEEATEIPLLIKTRSAHYPAVQARIAQLHPYEVPEIIALPITHGLPAYLDWLTEETSS